MSPRVRRSRHDVTNKLLQVQGYQLYLAKFLRDELAPRDFLALPEWAQRDLCEAYAEIVRLRVLGRETPY